MAYQYHGSTMVFFNKESKRRFSLGHLSVV